jgi:superfamily II DNA helicase RecQ
MSEATVEHQYFEHLVEYQVAVCRECRYAVWPDQIESHLRKQHKKPPKSIRAVGDAVRQWAGLLQYPSEWTIPDNNVQPIPQLPVYDDGLLCQLEPKRCRHIARTVDSIKKHWRKDHDGWSLGKKQGRPSRTRARTLQARMEDGCKRVHCQRLFGSRHGSQYFEVCHTPDSGPQPVPTEGEAAWARVGEEMAKTWASVENRVKRTIQDGEKDEAAPWLERTGWLPYLNKLDRPELLASIEEPNIDPEKEEEPVEAAIWNAMEGLARVSQASVINRTGIFVRMEAIRTEKHQTRYTPLQAYMDDKSIKERSRPWKQILMFFARTQREHRWDSPRYRFTQQQREAWEALIEQAERDVGGVEMEVADDIEDQDEDEEEEEEEDEMMIDELDDVQNLPKCDNKPDDEPKHAKLIPIEKACLKFCIALLNQRIRRKEYDCALVCALAVLGIKEDGWKDAELYPPILSSVIKITRFIVVQHALELSEPFEEELFDDDSGYGGSDSGSSSPNRCGPKGCLEFVQRMMDRFMVRGSHSPMQWMLDLRTYGLKVHFNTTARGNVEWMGRDELLYKNVHFTMAQFRSMVHGMQAESKRLLVEELLFCNRQTTEPVPQVPWEQLRDNPTDDRPGWNFLQDQRTRMPVDGEKWLFERVGQDVTMRARFVKPGTRSGIDRNEVERYMDRVVAFREKLLALMHMTAGQPARATEILSIRHSNTIKGGHRNIFIEDGMVVFVTRYHKGYAVSGDVKVIHRYLPREVGELLVWYLWLVLPFQQRLEAMVWEKEAISSHLWPADPNGRKWTSERVRETLKRESRIGLKQELTIAAYREIAIGISRRFLRGSTAFAAEEGEDNEEWKEENMAAIIQDEQSGHTAHVAGMVYARGIMEMAGVTADRRQLFRNSSTDWHRFLGFQSAVDAAADVKKRKRAPFESEADDARMERLERLRKMDPAAQLQRMKGKKAKFRGVQKESIKAIIAGESPVVAVMPTGAGKSMLFMLPAWAEQGGTTVVVVPLVSLRGDMMRRCKELGISCAEWQSRCPPDAAAIVFVTPESAVGEAFATFLNRLRAMRQLDRIVIDECHTVLNRRYTFRKQMQQLGRLAAAETQMVLLTATLPPTEEDELYRRMHYERGQVKMFRQPTTRTNVAYQTIKISRSAAKKGVESMVVETVRQKMRKYRTGKLIVYGNSRLKVKALSEQLDCHAYHADAVGKASMLADFMAGKQRVIVATSALGMGVDIPDVRCIIHIDWPFTMLDYAQESGRAGRDGLRSEAVLMVQDGKQRTDGDETEAERQLVRVYVEGGASGAAGCRREVLDGYLDGRKDRTGCREEDNEEMCDVCRGIHGQLEEVVEEETDEESGTENNDRDEMDVVEAEREEMQRVFRQQEQARRGPWQTLTEHRQQEFADVEWVRGQLAWWANRCGICEGAGNPQSRHDIRQCWRVESEPAKKMVQTIDELVRFDMFSGCFPCGGVPQEICNSWEPNEKGKYRRVEGGTCQYTGVLSGGLIGIAFGHMEANTRWKARLAELGVDDAGPGRMLIEYLGKKQQLDNVESNNLVKEFCWITRLLAE